MFGRIYGAVNKNAGNVKMLGHFIEELGELAEIMRYHLADENDLRQC